MISQRNGWIAFLILSLAIIPTASSFYRGLPIPPKRELSKLPDQIDGMIGVPTDRKAAKVLKNFRTNDWSERIYHSNTEPSITLFVASGYDLRPFFHLPEYAILDRKWSERSHAIDELTIDDAQINMHVLLLKGLKLDQRAYYLLLYDDRTIGNPYWFLARNLPKMVIEKRKPYTLIFVSYKSNSNQFSNTADERARKLLLLTLEHLS